MFRPVPKDDAVVVEWLGETGKTAEELAKAAGSEDRSALSYAKHVVYSILAEGPVLAKKAKRLALDAGVADRTLRRAKEALKVESKHRGYGEGSKWFWKLNPDEPVVKEFRERELDTLADKLFHGTSEGGDDSPDSKMKGKDQDEDPGNEGPEAGCTR